MAWKPWWERMADFDSAQERDAFLRGVFGPPPMTEKQVALMAVTALAAGVGTRQILRAIKK